MNSYFNIFIISCVSSVHTCCCYITSLQFSLNWTESLIKSCVNRTELYCCSAVSCVYRISWLRFLYFICSVHELLGIHASMYAEKIENWEDFRINGALLFSLILDVNMKENTSVSTLFVSHFVKLQGGQIISN